MQFFGKTIVAGLVFVSVLNCSKKNQAANVSAVPKNEQSFLGVYEGLDLDGKSCSVNVSGWKGDLDVSLDFGLKFEGIELPGVFSGVQEGSFQISSESPKYVAATQKIKEMNGAIGQENKKSTDFSVLFGALSAGGFSPFGKAVRLGFNSETGRPMFALVSIRYPTQQIANLCVFTKVGAPLAKNPLVLKKFDSAKMLGAHKGKDLNGKECSVTITGIRKSNAESIDFDVLLDGVKLPKFSSIPRGSFEFQSSSPDYARAESKIAAIGGSIGQPNGKTMDYSSLFGSLSAGGLSPFGKSVRLGLNKVTGAPVFVIATVEYPMEKYANVCIMD